MNARECIFMYISTLCNFDLNMERNTFKQDYEQVKTSKTFKTKCTRIEL